MSATHEQLRSELIAETLRRARGQHQPYCAFDRPNDEYFISHLAPIALSTESEDDDTEFTESRVSSIGLKTKPIVSDDQRSVDLSVSFAIYFRSFPTREEYEEITAGMENDDERGFGTTDKFHRRLEIEYETTLSLSDPEVEQDRISSELQQELESAFETSRDESVIYAPEVAESFEDESLEDDEVFSGVREAMQSSASETGNWTVDVEITVREPEMTITLANTTDAEQEQSLIDHYLFDPEIVLEGRFHSYTLSQIPEDFRYDRRIWAKGQNCSTEMAVTDTHRQISTAVVPSHQTRRFEMNDGFSEFTRFERLADDGEVLPALEAIAEGMETYYEDWSNPEGDERATDLSDDELEEYLDAAEQFREEIDHFERGLEILDNVDAAKRAFSLMNRTFDEGASYPGWRLFQIVFIVSNLGAIVSREYPEYHTDKDDRAEVLWFPTGGGKTAAYQGLIVFNLLFDRIRGKERGVTGWIRFPLRLLGKQQKDRFLNILMAAEAVRQDALNGAGEPFSIGYFVGSHDTPNSIRNKSNKGNNYWNTFVEEEDKRELRRQCQVVTECPVCEGEVDVEFDADVNTVYHYCDSASCSVGRLPLYVTDHDIYRNLPSVLLGTLDKISITGANPRFTNLLGNLTDKCPTHGYGYAGKCSEGTTIGCSEDLEPVTEELYDPVPTLHLIDEVHLVEEELGVFASHYETLYLELCRQASDRDAEPKIITSTATIAEYDQQMRDLFLKRADRFPEEGPTLDESFYGSVNEESPEREYLGLMPTGMSHIMAVMNLVRKYHEAIRDFRDVDTIPLEGCSRDEYLSMLDMYELSVVYFLKRTEKDRYMRGIQNQVNRALKQNGYDDPIEITQLTSDQENLDLLDELKNPDEPFVSRHDTVAATSFIGHGIDVDRFNTIFFFGYPSETFQYIQASARIGREVPGTVLNLFKAYDERDRHRYKYFSKTHEYLRRSVEPASIDRWSKFSLDKTFPGLFKALLVQHYRPLMHQKYNMNVQSSADLSEILEEEESYPEFSRNQYENMLLGAYGLMSPIADDEFFRSKITEKTQRYWEYWEKHLEGEYFTRLPEDAMRNLRDIGDQKQINLDNNQASFYSNLLPGE